MLNFSNWLISSLASLLAIPYDGASPGMVLSRVEQEGISRIFVETGDCMLYERLWADFDSEIIDVNFKCLDMNEVHVFSAKPTLYDINIVSIEEHLYLDIAYCASGMNTYYRVGDKILLRIRKNFQSLPLHRLNISKVEVISACRMLLKETLKKDNSH